MDWKNATIMSYNSKSSIYSMDPPSKYQWHFSPNRKKTIVKFVWNPKRPQRAKPILRNNEAGGTTLCDKATAIKTVWYQREKQTQTNERVQFRTNPCLHGQLIFDKGAKSIPWGKSTLGKSCWENWINSCRAMKSDPYLTPHTKIQN